jgi:hypothetical protein
MHACRQAGRQSPCASCTLMPGPRDQDHYSMGNKAAASPCNPVVRSVHHQQGDQQHWFVRSYPQLTVLMRVIMCQQERRKEHHRSLSNMHCQLRMPWSSTAACSP